MRERGRSPAAPARPGSADTASEVGDHDQQASASSVGASASSAGPPQAAAEYHHQTGMLLGAIGRLEEAGNRHHATMSAQLNWLVEQVVNLNARVASAIDRIGLLEDAQSASLQNVAQRLDQLEHGFQVLAEAQGGVFEEEEEEDEAELAGERQANTSQ